MMHLVFCCDRGVLAALHVAAYSALRELRGCQDAVVIHLFANDFSPDDLGLLRQTLDRAGCPYSLECHAVDVSSLTGIPTLNHSLAPYFRLFVPALLEVPRFLYLDADILCQVNLQPLFSLDLGGNPAGLAPEAPIHASGDPAVLAQLGPRAQGHYYNSGVMVVDRDTWQSKDTTARLVQYIRVNSLKFHDQSALNYVLHGHIATLPEIYNTRANAREHWPLLKSPRDGRGILLHYIDYPKPWSPFGRWVHPFGHLWWRTYRQTAHFAHRPRPSLLSSLRHVSTRKSQYWKYFKDQLLFSAYNRGLPFKPKGVR